MNSACINKLTLTAAAGLALVAPADALAAGDDDTIPESTTAQSTPGQSIVFTNEGDPAQQVLLQPPMVVGRARITEMTTTAGTVEITGAQTLSTPIDVSTTTQLAVDVTSVEADDGFAAETTVESFDMTIAQGGDVAGSFAFGDDYAALEGMTLPTTYTADRSLVSITPPPGTTLTAEQQAAIDELNESEDGVTSALPDEPVGLGAEWQAQLPFQGAEALATFRLVSVDGSSWQLDFEFEADASAMETAPSIESATGTIAATGTMTGDATNPFLATNQATMDFDVALTGPDGVITLDLQASTHQTVEPG